MLLLLVVPFGILLFAGMPVAYALMLGTVCYLAGTGESLTVPAQKMGNAPDSFTLLGLPPILPPSIPMVIYGGMADVSVGRLFLGGAIPGTLMGLYLMVVVYLLARRRGHVAAPRASGAALWASTKAAALPLLMPVIILGGI